MALAVYAGYLIYREYRERSKSGEWTEEEKLWAREGSLFVICIFAVMVATFHLLFIGETPFSLTNAMRYNTSSFAAVRMILPLIYLVWLLPGAVLGEVFYSRIKRRRLRPWNFLIFALMIGEWALTSALLLTVFDLLLRDMSILVQFPLMAISFSLSMLITVATMEKTRLKGYLKRTFD